MKDVLFITHADVVISADVPINRWPLNARGRERHHRHTEALRNAPPALVWSSDEQKALDGAQIMADALCIPHRVDPMLAENDRTSTGYMPEDQFWEAVDAFFGNPDESYRGWETACGAQARVIAAVDRICDQSPDGTIAIVAHGGIGALLYGYVTRQPILSTLGQPGRSGGNSFRFTWPEITLIHGWQNIG